MPSPNSTSSTPHSFPVWPLHQHGMNKLLSRKKSIYIRNINTFYLSNETINLKKFFILNTQEQRSVIIIYFTIVNEKININGHIIDVAKFKYVGFFQRTCHKCRFYCKSINLSMLANLSADSLGVNIDQLLLFKQLQQKNWTAAVGKIGLLPLYSAKISSYRIAHRLLHQTISFMYMSNFNFQRYLSSKFYLCWSAKTWISTIHAIKSDKLSKINNIILPMLHSRIRWFLQRNFYLVFLWISVWVKKSFE